MEGGWRIAALIEGWGESGVGSQCQSPLLAELT